MTAFGFMGMCIGFLGCFISPNEETSLTKWDRTFAAIFWVGVVFFVSGIASKLWEIMP